MGGSEAFGVFHHGICGGGLFLDYSVRHVFFVSLRETRYGEAYVNRAKNMKTVASACAVVTCVAGAYWFVYLPSRPADVSHARISINAKGGFNKSQIDGAVEADIARLESWNGCSVDAIRYDAKRSAALLAAEHSITASGGSSSISEAIDEYGMDNVIYLSNDISCRAGSQNSSQNGWGSWYAWDPGSAQAEHGWIFIDEGY